MLELNAPLIVLDVETTGVHKRVDRVIQIGLVKFMPDGEKKEWETLVNPMIPIPPETIPIHRITDDMVCKAPTFKEIGPGLAAGFKGCDFAGFNVDFDLGFLEAEFRRITTLQIINGRVIDVMTIYKTFFPRTLADAVQEYLGRKMEGAHNAMVDARETANVLEAQLRRHQDLPQTVEGIYTQFRETTRDGLVDSEGKLYWRYGEACINFGTHAGTRLQDVDPGWLSWVLRNDFSDEFKSLIRAAQRGLYPERKSNGNPT